MAQSWLVINPGSHYHDACLSKALCKPNQFLVIGWNQWIKWYQNADKLGILSITTPPPAFVGDTYEIAKGVADELNNKQTMEGINK